MLPTSWTHVFGRVRSQIPSLAESAVETHYGTMVPRKKRPVEGDDMVTRILHVPLVDLRLPELDSRNYARPSDIGRLRFALLSLCLVLLGARAANAQLDRGGIVGVVTDESQAVLPGTTVAITNTETGQVTTMITDTAGRYAGALLRIGTYTVTAEQIGFSKTVQSNVLVSVGQVANVNLVLKVGTIDEQVQVIDAPPLIDAQSSSIGTIETAARIVALPLNGRNFIQDRKSVV